MLVLPDAVLDQVVVSQPAESRRGEGRECFWIRRPGDLPGQFLAERQRGREPRAVAAGRDPEAWHVRHGPEHEPPVRAHREHAAAVLGNRAARSRHLTLHLAGQNVQHRAVKRHLVRRRADVKGQRPALESARHQPAASGAQVDGRVDDADDRIALAGASRLGDQQLVAHRRDSHGAAGQLSDLPGPRPCRVHDRGRGDRAPRGLHASDAAAGQRDGRDCLVLEHLGAVLPGGGLIGADQVDRLFDIDVLRAPKGEPRAAGVQVVGDSAVDLRGTGRAEIDAPAT